jgi:hypothetical protein
MLHLLIEVSKFLGLFLAGVFGILGVLTEYRDEEGKITKWGRRAVIGTIVSTMVAFISQGLEFQMQAQEQHEANEKSLKQAQANTALLEQLSRAVDPLNSFEVWAWVGVDFNTPELAAYGNRVSQAINEALKSAKPEDRYLKNGIVVTSRESDFGKILSVAINPTSPSFPNERTEPVAYYLVRYLDISFRFKKASLPSPAGEPPIPDLEIDVGTADEPSSVALTYNVEKKQFEIEATSMQANSEFWRNHGNVLAVPDLYKLGTTVAIVSGVGFPPGNPLNAKILKSRRNLSIRVVSIRLPRGRKLWLRNWPQPKLDDDGLSNYDVALPKLQ